MHPAPDWHRVVIIAFCVGVIVGAILGIVLVD